VVVCGLVGDRFVGGGLRGSGLIGVGDSFAADPLGRRLLRKDLGGLVLGGFGDFYARTGRTVNPDTLWSATTPRKPPRVAEFWYPY